MGKDLLLGQDVFTVSGVFSAEEYPSTRDGYQNALLSTLREKSLP